MTTRPRKRPSPPPVRIHIYQVPGDNSGTETILDYLAFLVAERDAVKAAGHPPEGVGSVRPRKPDAR